MCGIIDNELFDNIIIGEYWSNDNKRIKGVYTTKSDDAVVVNINVWERLLNGIKILDGNNPDFTLEEAERVFGDQIIQRYLASHGVADIFSLEEIDQAVGDQIITKRSMEKANSDKEAVSLKASVARRENIKKAQETRSDSRAYSDAMILKSILEGSSKEDVMNIYDISIGKINKALRDLDEQKVRAIWNKYRTSVFNGVDMKVMESFISDDCNYKKFRKRLALDNEAAFRKAVDKQIEEMKDFNFYADKRREYSDKLVEMGFSSLNGVVKTHIEEEVEDGDEVAKVLAIINQPVEEIKTPTVKKTIEPQEDKFAVMYAEKMNKLDKTNGVASISSPRKGFRPRPKAGIVSGGSCNSVMSEVHIIEEE